MKLMILKKNYYDLKFTINSRNVKKNQVQNIQGHETYISNYI